MFFFIQDMRQEGKSCRIFDMNTWRAFVSIYDKITITLYMLIFCGLRNVIVRKYCIDFLFLKWINIMPIQDAFLQHEFSVFFI